MKRTIGVLTMILGLAVTGPLLAYPTDNGTVNDSSATMGKQSGTMNNTTGTAQPERMKLDQLPQQVQSTINDHSQNGQVKRIERMSENNGQTFYIITLKTSDGTMQHFRVDANGEYQGVVSGHNWSNQNGNTQYQNTGGQNSASQPQR